MLLLQRGRRRVVATVAVCALFGAMLTASGVTPDATAHPARRVLVLIDDNGAASGGLHLETVTVPRGSTVEDQLAELRGRSDVRAVSPGDVVYHAAGTPSNDTYRSQQWALDRLAAEDARALATGSGVTVALVDSGVNPAHPDLQGVLLPGADFIASTDGTGGNGWTDTFGHGTHVAGLIAATVGNSLGTAGLAPATKILPVRAMDDTGSVTDARLASGILWATAHGANVINLSLGASSYSSVVAAAVQDAQDHGIVVVAAAGNLYQSGNPTFYPAAFPGVLGVGATTSTDARAVFSETGSFVDVAAPGNDILSTCAGILAVQGGGAYGGAYCRLNGTSMSTAYTSALVSMTEQRFPSATPSQVIDLIERTAQDLGTPGADTSFGSGIISPVATLSGAPDTTAPAISGVGVTPSTTGAVVTWTTTEASSSTVSYGATTSLGQTASTPGNVTSHSVTVAGLTCASTYQIPRVVRRRGREHRDVAVGQFNREFHDDRMPAADHHHHHDDRAADHHHTAVGWWVVLG